MSSNKFCTNCGQKLNSESKFCNNCGNQIDGGSSVKKDKVLGNTISSGINFQTPLVDALPTEDAIDNYFKYKSKQVQIHSYFTSQMLN